MPSDGLKGLLEGADRGVLQSGAELSAQRVVDARITPVTGIRCGSTVERMSFLE